MNTRVALFAILMSSSFSSAEVDPDLSDFLIEQSEAVEPDEVSTLRHKALKQFYAEKDSMKFRYRQSLAEVLLFTTRIDIYLLDFELEIEVDAEEYDRYFPIKPYHKFSRIIDQKTPKAEHVNDCKLVFSKLMKEPNEVGTMCHFPIHGIRFYSDEDILFETSLCWNCGNYFVEYPDDFRTATWVGFNSRELKALLYRFLPIPEQELKRFDKKYGTKKDAEQGVPAKSDRAGG